MRLGPSTSTSSIRPDALAVAGGGHALDRIDQALDPLALDLLRHLIGHRRGLGALPRRVDEREGTVVADLLDRRQRLLEVLLGLAGEADDQVGRERQIRDRGSQLLHEAQVALPRVGAPHRLQNARRAGLERQVRVLADGLALGHRPDHGRAEILRVRAGEADAVDAVDPVAGAQELGERRCRRSRP